MLKIPLKIRVEIRMKASHNFSPEWTSLTQNDLVRPYCTQLGVTNIRGAGGEEYYTSPSLPSYSCIKYEPGVTFSPSDYPTWELPWLSEDLGELDTSLYLSDPDRRYLHQLRSDGTNKWGSWDKSLVLGWVVLRRKQSYYGSDSFEYPRSLIPHGEYRMLPSEIPNDVKQELIEFHMARVPGDTRLHRLEGDVRKASGGVWRGRKMYSANFLYRQEARFNLHAVTINVGKDLIEEMERNSLWEVSQETFLL